MSDTDFFSSDEEFTSPTSIIEPKSSSITTEIILDSDPEEGFGDIEIPQTLQLHSNDLMDWDIPDADTLISRLNSKLSKSSNDNRIQHNFEKRVIEPSHNSTKLQNINILFPQVSKINEVSGTEMSINGRGRKKPTLISPSIQATPQVVGGMTFDPVSQSWTGNEEILDDFIDEPLHSSAKPNFIPHNPSENHYHHSTNGAQTEMIFDPILMKWIGNEEDLHLFDDIDPLEPLHITPKQDPFRLSKGMEAKFAISEANHKLFMGAWYPRVVQTSRSVMRDTSKTFLYEIRNLS